MAVLKKIIWSARVALLAPLLFAAACASGCNDRAESAEQVETPQAPARHPENDRPPFLSSRGGPPSTPVTVSMSGLVMNARLTVGFGSFVENQIVRHAQADQDGAVSVTVPIPATARPGVHYFFLAEEDGSSFAVSNPFLVTAPDGSVRLRGRVTTEGAQCTAIRSGGDELFTLLGEIGSPAPDSRVTVWGTIAQTSICQQGLTIAVTRILVEPQS
jgi:hypothetical protein